MAEKVKEMTVTAADAPVVRKKKANFYASAFSRLMKNKVAFVSLVVILILVVLAVLAPWICKYNYKTIDPINQYLSPSSDHFFGTDSAGRDLFSRVLYGARYSLSMALTAEVLAIVCGTILGACAGFFGGLLSDVIMRCCDILQAIPETLLCIIISQSLGAGLSSTILALAISSIPGSLRTVRALVMSMREQEYVEAGKAITCSNARLIFVHIIPNVIPQLLISFTGGISGKLLRAAGLSYLGLGVQPPLPEWGALLADGKTYFRYYPHMVIFPGLFILITALAFNLLGDGLRDALDPRLRD